MRKIIGCGLALLFGVGPGLSSAQAPPANAIDIANADVRAALDKETQELKSGTSVIDRLVNLTDVGKYNVAIATVVRPAGTFTNSLTHDKITEIYYVVRGSGIQVTGTMLDGTRGTRVSPVVGPGMSSNTPLTNVRSRKLGPGDIQIVPPGVAHGFTSIDPGGIEYLVFRVDPEHVLALQ